MHPSAYEFATTALTVADVKGSQVIEAGGLNVNGTARDVIEAMEPGSYVSTDMRAGPGVDVVCDAADRPARFGAGTADVVVCTEMLEHAADWRSAVTGMVTLLAPGGLLLITTRGPGFPLHGYPDDHWRFTPGAGAGLDVLRCEPDPGAAGLLALARKPDPWEWPDGVAAAWDTAEVTVP